MEPTTYYLAHARSTPAHSRLIVDGVGLFGLGLVLVALLLRAALHRRRARAATRSLEDLDERLVLGPAVLAGRVLDVGDGSPVVLEIEQSGREWQDRGRFYHRWREERRQLEARPFYLERPSGERVRVEPDASALLVHPLDETQKLGWLWRKRRARLRAGAAVYVVGRLERAMDPLAGGYRDGSEAWVLRPPESGRMLISTEPLAERHLRRARTYRHVALAVAAYALLAHAALFGQFHLLRATGRVVDADVNGREVYGHFLHGAWVPSSFVARAVFTDPMGDHTVKDEVNHAFYAQLGCHVWRQVPFVVSSLRSVPPQLGREPAVDSDRLLLFVLLTGLVLGGAGAVLGRSRDWWDRPRLVETGAGRIE